MTVESVLIINNFGKPRLANFYRRPLLPVGHQQLLIRTIFKLISTRDDEHNCNFLDAPELKPLLQRGEEKHSQGQELKVIYRHYATLWFVFVVDQSESELGILDLIQVRSAKCCCSDNLGPSSHTHTLPLSPSPFSGIRRIARPFLPKRL